MGGDRQFKRARFAIWLMLFHICFPILSAEPPTPEPFLPPHANVIVLSGLSGDLQSETSFHAQLNDWLQLLSALPTPPAQIYTFSDDPDSLSLPAQSPVQKFKSTRENFLSLTNTLAKQTNPLVVIAWGHGGMQGNTPVFHVAGPRLTAVDFKNFAAQIPSLESRWLLFFRGSGKFAAQLASEHCFLIASENETTFNSDPIGLPLALKSLRANPSLTFQSLGNELGRVTVAWYQERNLIRTEEPTLWLANATPLELAPPESAITSDKSATNSESPSPSASTSAPGQTVTTNLPAAWTGISRVEPRDYPDVDGVVLRRRIGYTLSGSVPAITSENEDFIQVLTAEGKHLADFDFSYSPPEEDINFLNCEVLESDGKLIALNPDEVRDAAGESWGDYRAARRKIFSLPGAMPGAVLHVRYQTSWKTFPFPYVSMPIPVAADLPILDAAVQVSVPKDAAFHFAFDQLAASDPEIKQSTYGSTYSWRFDRLPATLHETLSAPVREPSLLISTFPDWQAFTAWYARISQLADTVTPAITAKAAELTRDATTDTERATDIFNFVTGLRYVPVELGVNSFRPHAAEEVLEHQYGDCKDKANLFNALLHSLKLDAHLVLVPRFSQAYDNLPGFAFNHAISRVQLGDQTLWVDTTDDVCRFGMLPPGDPGRKVLVVDSTTAGLTQLPEPTPSAHQLLLHAQIDCANVSLTGQPVTLKATANGFPDYALRAAAQDNRGHKNMLPLLAVHYRPIAGAFGLTKQNHTPAAALGQTFEWEAEGNYVGIVSIAENQARLRAPFWLPKEWDVALDARQTPLFLHQGYPLSLDEDFEFTLPASASAIRFPNDLEGTSPLLPWKIAWQHNDGNSIHAKFHIELNHGELTLAETTALQAELRKLFSALAGEVDFTLPP
ncbi:MAG TPA: DUF3857 domain-containing protein [Verrucomicrobiae bacterium]|jgi:hypothetical protein|nr:DUF3857 domain-containing protein [Verrucomicrobiae bacterium]